MNTLNTPRPTIAWRIRLKEGNNIYTENAIREADELLDEYLTRLNTAGVERDIWRAIRQVVEGFNGIHENYDDFIDTIEREELAGFIQSAAEAAGLEYDGDVTEEWRDW